MVAVSPSSLVWQAAQDAPAPQARSSWSRAGTPLPFLPLRRDSAFYRTYDKRLLFAAHSAALAMPDTDRAQLPVERIPGPLLLTAGGQDGVWPAAHMSALIANARDSVYDPHDPVGRLLFNVLAMVDEFESDLIRLRTKEGMRVAKAKGRLRGKQPKLNPRQEAHLVGLYRLGEHSTAELGDLFGVARSTVYRALQRDRARGRTNGHQAASNTASIGG